MIYKSVAHSDDRNVVITDCNIILLCLNMELKLFIGALNLDLIFSSSFNSPHKVFKSELSYQNLFSFWEVTCSSDDGRLGC